MTGVVDTVPARVGAGRLFAAVTRWASSTGTATAVSASDGILSFDGLADRTRLLAGALAAEGVGPGVPVGLCAGRSRLAVPSLLAVWWLGATAVPMDDRHPADRLNFLLRDADVHVLLADRLAAGSLHIGHAASLRTRRAAR